jgi:hypothetical protein
MSNMIVPEQVIPALRSGARLALGSAAADLAGHSGRGALDTPPLEERERLDQAWALLDVLGWSGDPQPVELELRDHRAALLQAADGILPLLAEWLSETDPADPRQAERADERRLLLQFAEQVRQPAGRR